MVDKNRGASAGRRRSPTVHGDHKGLLAAVLEGIDEGVAVLGENGELLTSNAIARQILGVAGAHTRRTDEQGYSGLFQLDGTTPLSPAETPWSRAVASMRREEADLLVRDGPATARLRVVARPRNVGRKRAAVVVFHDLPGHQVRYPEQVPPHSPQAAVLDLAHDPIVVWEPDGTLTYANRAAESLYGWPREELIGRIIHDVLRTRFPVSRQQVTDELLTAGRWSGELEHRRRDGSTLLVHSRQAVQRQDGRPVAVIEINSDITARRADENRLRGSEEQLRLLLDGAPDYAIVMVGRDGRFTSWSASAERLTGYTEAATVGESFAMLFTPAAMADGTPEDLLASARAGGQDIEGIRVRRDGSQFWSSGTMTPMHNDDSTLRGFVMVINDATKCHGAETRFRGLLDSAPDAMIGVGADGRILFANVQTELLFGYARAELLGRRMEMLLPRDARKAHVGHRNRFLGDPQARPMGTGMELAAVRKDGSEFPVEVSLNTLETEEGLIASASVRDISERRRAQSEIESLNGELRRSNDDLESRVAERTAALVAQTTQLANSNAELEAFSYSVSHDLRAPLRTMDGFAKMLLLHHSGDLDDTGRQYLDKVRAGAQQMALLIDGLLAFFRLQRQVLVRRPVDMTALSHRVWEQLALERAGRQIELTVDPLPESDADAQLLGHVLTNLLGNAIKYTRVRSPARITVSATVEAGTDVTYSVCDNGVGFDMRYADKLFQVFQRMHRAEDYEGTGIGLALAARIVHRHGGRIWAEARPDAGANFHFTLPALGAEVKLDEGGVPRAGPSG